MELAVAKRDAPRASRLIRGLQATLTVEFRVHALIWSDARQGDVVPAGDGIALGCLPGGAAMTAGPVIDSTTEQAVQALSQFVEQLGYNPSEAARAQDETGYAEHDASEPRQQQLLIEALSHLPISLVVRGVGDGEHVRRRAVKIMRRRLWHRIRKRPRLHPRDTYVGYARKQIAPLLRQTGLVIVRRGWRELWSRSLILRR